MSNWGQPPAWYLQQQAALQQQQAAQQQAAQQQAAAAAAYYPVVPPGAYPYPRQNSYYYPNQAPQAPPQPPTWNAGAYVATDHPYRADIRSKYPQLNPVIASDLTILSVDTSKKPITCILMQTFYAYRNTPAIHHTNNPTPVTHLRLYSKSFPWSIDIVTKQAEPVKVGVVWEAMYGCLQEPIADSEWAMMCKDKKAKERAERAMKKRLELDPAARDRRMKRIDYLGEEKFFKGLERDEEFEKTRTLPGSAPFEGEVWVVKMADK